jgi:cobalt-precorrin 5A hydrolase
VTNTSRTRPATIAALAVTRGGSQLAARLGQTLPAIAYVPQRFLEACCADTDPIAEIATVVGYDEPVAELLRRLFPAYGALVPVMAIGAAVRLLAPLLADKRSDPAVVVVDDAGRFAVSLLSGHAGGANRLAARVATAVGATPVITTASESAGVPAADLLGSEYGWRIEPGSALKSVAAALVNGDPVGVYQDCGDRRWLDGCPPHVEVYPSLEILRAAGPTAAIIVSDRALELSADLEKRCATYRPPSLALGIGCSSGAGAAEIEELVSATLADHGLSPLAVAGIATLDRRAEEPGLHAVARRHAWPLLTFSPAELAEVAGEWSASAVVQRAVGVGAVAEPCALRFAGTERLLVRKVKSARVTLAIARCTPAPVTAQPISKPSTPSP